MGKIYFRRRTAIKDYMPRLSDGNPYEEVVRQYQNELFAYTELSFATPRLVRHQHLWLEMERLTPLPQLPREESVQYRTPLWEVLQRVHEAGWWHRDLSVDNVVIHPERGPLLIDWEWLAPAVSDISFDLHGAKAAGVDPPFPLQDGNGSYWASGGRSPNYWWKGL